MASAENLRSLFARPAHLRDRFPKIEEHRFRYLAFCAAARRAILGCLPAGEMRDSGRFHTDWAALFAAHNCIFKTTLFPEELSGEESEFLGKVSEDLPASVSLDDVSYLYERIAQPESAKRQGAFYTPRQIVQLMLQLVIQGGPLLRWPTLLDPACGSGVFLLEAARMLACQPRAATSQHRAEMVKSCLFGVDKDPLAVELTRVLLNCFILGGSQRELFPSSAVDLSDNIKVGNSLIEPLDIKDGGEGAVDDLLPFSWAAEFPRILERGGFNIIVGNPPYGLSRDEQMTRAENDILKRAYSEYRHGKVNKYLAFMARGYSLLEPRGILSFIVPNAWLGIQGGVAMRRRFMGDLSLRDLYVFHCKVFEDRGVEPIVFVADKSKRHRFIRISHVTSLDRLPVVKTTLLPASACRQTPDFQIPTRSSPGSRQTLRRIEASGLRLGDRDSPFRPMIALQAYAEGKGAPPQSSDDVKNHVFHTAKHDNDSCIPYLEGADIRRYQIAWSGQYLRHGPWLAEPQTLERFQGARILVREVINPWPYVLNAAMISEPYLYNKSVLHILPKGHGVEEEFLALLAILNSKLGSFYIMQRGHKSQRRLFPKVVNQDLRVFPLPRHFQQQASRLSAGVLELTNLLERGSRDSSSLEAEVQVSIDRAVYQSYDLSSSDMNAIEEYGEAATCSH